MGEPFQAEIDLLAYRDEGSARPRMAPPDAYKLANFNYSAALSGSRLLIKKHANGRDYIEVTSPRAVNEPFVYLLIELDWNGSRLVRAYTALLDPPGYGAPRAAALPLPVPELRTIPATSTGFRSRPSAAAGAAALPALPKTSVPLPRRDPPGAIAAVPVDPVLAGRLGQLEKQVSAGAKTLSGLLDRVTVMEAQVQQLQRMIEAQNARAAAAPKPAATTPAARVAVVPKAEVAATPAVQPPATSPAVPAQSAPVQPLPAVPALQPAAAPTQPAPPQPAPVAPKVAAAPPAPVEPQPSVTPLRRGDSLVNEALLVLVGGSLILAGWLMYLIWGRKRKPAVSTEDILVKMLARDPERDDVQVKLLEIYAGRGDKTAYQNMAIKLHKVTGGQGDTWHRAAATGHALDPGNPLYADGRYAVMSTTANDAHAVRH